MPKTKELMHIGPEVDLQDTAGVGSVPEPFAEFQVPNDEAWSLQVGTLLELYATNGSNEHIPGDLWVYIMKFGPEFDSLEQIPGAKMRYSNWEGFTIQEQRSEEFRGNTKIQMAVNNAVFGPREKLVLACQGDVAVDISQDNFHIKLDVQQVNRAG